MSNSDFHSIILNYIEEFHDVDIDDIESTTPLFSSNIMDSFAMVELVAFIEEKADIKFQALDLHLNNLDSIEKILAFVALKKA
jgi:acyl carrier protein